MRFLSKYGRFQVTCRRLIVEHYATGTSRVLQEPLEAHFHEGALLPEERELAIATWTFNGGYQEQDEATWVPPDYRIGLFDSELAQLAHGWSDEDRPYSPKGAQGVAVRTLVELARRLAH